MIPTRRWRLARYDESGKIHYTIAILQAEARSEFNTSQYASCMKAMLGYSPVDPEGNLSYKLTVNVCKVMLMIVMMIVMI